MEISPSNALRNVAELPVEKLAGNAALTEREKLSEACRQFEAILLRQVLQNTQRPVIQSRFANTSVSAGIYQDMITGQLAESISKSGALGLAQTFERQLTRPFPGAAPATHQQDHSPS